MLSADAEERGHGRLFSDKVVLTKENQYDGVKNGAAWRVTTGNYFVSRIPEIDVVLKLIEDNEDVPATVMNISEAVQHAIPAHKVQGMATELWGYLNLNLIESARRTFSNAPKLEGF